MNDEASSSIGIYGMGGVGKTTLLTHIYNQLLQERGTFPHVRWITVSQDFSVYKLQNLIAQDIDLDLSNEDNERKRAAKLSKALIKKQRWVLILDDLWDCFDYNKVGIPIRVKGCKLILTTRSFGVCQRILPEDNQSGASFNGRSLGSVHEGTWMYSSRSGRDCKIYCK
jgi:disease resistance protein RPS2